MTECSNWDRWLTHPSASELNTNKYNPSPPFEQDHSSFPRCSCNFTLENFVHAILSVWMNLNHSLRFYPNACHLWQFSWSFLHSTKTEVRFLLSNPTKAFHGSHTELIIFKSCINNYYVLLISPTSSWSGFIWNYFCI